MARASKPVLSGNTSNNRILVSVPEPNANISINSVPNGTLVYQFDTSDATFGRAGDSLEIRLDNGGAITVVDYFAVGSKSLPNFELPDGSVVSAKDFLSASAPGMDLSTASGPTSTQQAPGSGSGEYREGAGELIGSVDRLGMLGTSYNQWSNSTLGASVYAADSGVLEDDISISTPFGAGPGGPTVHEAGLENGTNPGEGVNSGWHQMVLPRGVSVVGVPEGGSATFQGDYGILTVRHLGGSTYEYSYTLHSAHKGSGANDGQNTEVDADLITIPITNGSGSGTAQIAIDIVDDMPELTVGDGSGPEGDGTPAYSGFDVTGKWDVNFGADGEKSGGGLQMKISVDGKETTIAVTPDTILKVEVNGTNYGTIEFKSDGTYVFKPVSNLEEKITIILGATDGDGDFVQANDGKGIVIEVKKPPLEGFGALGDKPDEWFSESNIKGGTAPNLSQTTKDIALPDGMKVDVTTEGWTEHKDADGNKYYTLDTDYGHLTYYPPVEGGSGSLYQPPRLTYTLDEAAMHGGEEVFYDKSAGKVTLVDAGGNSYEVDTNFKIYDDDPVVTFSGTGGESVKSGHDLNGTWSTVFGADGAAEEDSMFVTITVDGKSKDFPVTPDEKITLEIDGKVYGEIEFKTGGDFVFTPAPNLEAELELSLSAKDKEGDVVTAKDGSLKVTVTPPEGPGDPSLRPKDDEPVRESGLPEGTNPNPDDLVKEIEIPPGFVIDTDSPGWEKQPDGTYVKEKEDGGSKLVYNPDDNTLIYELEESQEHGEQGRDKTDDIFDDIVLKDDKGNTYDDIKVIVELEDDIPEVSVNIDSNTVTEDGSVSGEIEYDFGSDGPHEDEPLQVTITGPDGKEVTFPIKNEEGEQVIDIIIDGEDYGDLVVNLDPDKGTGEFEFIPDPEKGGSDLEFEFSAQDKDGDIVTAPGETISITDKDGPGINFIGGGQDEWFSEANLPEGTDSANSSALTKPIGLPDDCSVDVGKGGWKLDPESGNYMLEGKYGYLSCDPDGNNLTYTLTDRADHSVSGKDKVLDVIPDITIMDGDGNAHELPAKITVRDDQPEAFFSGGSDSNSIGSGQTFEGNWDVQFGADGEKKGGGLQLEVSVGGKKALIDVTPDKPTAIIVDGKNYGSITLDSTTGKYQFEAAPNTEGSLKFVLVATDSEGDTVRSGDGFTIKVTGPEGPGTGQLTGKGDNVSESSLPDGTDPDPGGLTQEIDLPDGYEVDTGEGGWTKNPDTGKWELESPSGSGHLTYDPETGDLTYTLDKPFEHEEQGADKGQEIIPGIVIKDEDGNSFEVEVKVDLEDDVPELSFTGEKSVESGDAITGDWDVDFGADGPADEGSLTIIVEHPSSQGSLEVSFDDDELPKSVDVIIDDVNYGKLTLNEDKTYTFEAAPDLEGERLDVTLSAKDGDGDVTVSDTVVIEIVEPGGPGIGYLTTKDGSAFEEANFSSGTNPDQGSLTKVLNLPDGFTVDVGKGGWQLELGSSRYILESPAIKGPDGQLINGFGKLTYDSATNTLTYTLTGRVFNGPDSDMGMDTIPDIVVKDENGNSFKLDVIVDITDDAPELDFSGEGDISSGGVYTGDWSYMFGADGAADRDSITITVTDAHGNTKTYSLAVGSDTEIAVGGVRYGALHLGDDGKFTFQAMPNVEGKLSLNMTIRDRDGDALTSEAPFELEFSKPVLPPGFVIGGGKNEWFSESYLKGGTEASDPDAFVTRELALPKNSNGDLCVPDVSDWIKKGDGVYVKQGSSGHLTWNENTGKLTYTLEKPATHTDPGKHGADDVALENIQVTLKDPQGNTYVVGSEIKLHDDAPSFDFKLEQDTVESGGTLTGSLGLQFGADGQASGAKALQVEVTITVDGKEVTFTVPLKAGSTGQLTHDGVNYGSISVNKDYSFSFKTAPNIAHEINVNFVATDKDGDRVWSSEDDGTSINVIPPKTTPPDVFGKGENEWFAESNLSGGTEEDASALAKPIAIPDGFSIDTTGWTLVGGKSIYELESPSGKLTYDASKNTLTYTLTNNVAHGDPATSGNEDVVKDDVFDIILKDANNNTFHVNAEIAVYDDAPEAEMYSSAGEVGAEGQSGKEYSGVWEVNFGADGPEKDAGTAMDITINVTVYPIDADGNLLPGEPKEYSFSMDITAAHLRGEPIQIGKYGMITFVESPAGSGKGSFVFKPAGNLMADFDIRLGATDSDGDHRVVNGGDGFEFNVRPTPPPVTESEGIKAEGPVDEAHLSTGTDPDASGVSVNVPLPVTNDGTPCVVDVTLGGWERVGNSDIYTLVQGSGKLTYDKGGNALTYTLTDSVDHGAPGSATDASTSQNIHIVITDGENTWGRDVVVSVTDDAPDVDMLGQNGQTSGAGQSGREFTGTWDVDFGADGASEATETAISLAVKVSVYPTDADGNKLSGAPKDHSFNFDLTEAQLRGEPVQLGEYGTIRFVESPAGSGKGSFVFKPAGNLMADFEFKLGATDSDGDFRTNNDGNGFEFKVTPTPPPVSETEGIKADGAVDEAHLADGTSPDAAGVSTNVPLPVTKDGTQCTIDLTQGGWERDGNSDIYTLVQGSGKLTYDKGSNSLTYTLIDNVSHGDPGSATDASAPHNVQIVITDGENTWSRDVVVSVTDDAPDVDMLGDNGQSGGAGQSGREFSGTWEVDFGADGANNATETAISLVVNVKVHPTDADGNKLPGAPKDHSFNFDLTEAQLRGEPIQLGEYGTIRFVESPTGSGKGSFVFKPAGNLMADFEFKLGATDSDGDYRVNNDGNGFEFKVTPTPPPVSEADGLAAEKPVDEAHLPGGTDPDESGTSTNIPLPVTKDGTQCVVDVTQGGWEREGNSDIYTLVQGGGKLTYDKGDNSLTYTLTENAEHGAPNSGTDSSITQNIPIVITDGENTWGRDVIATVTDDAPEVEFGGDSDSASSGYDFTGTWEVDFGADGEKIENNEGLQLKVTVGGEDEVFNIRDYPKPGADNTYEFDIVVDGKNYGKITLVENPDGENSYTFVPVPNLDAEMNFVLGATDTDGDFRTNNDGDGFTIKVTPPPGPNIDHLGGGADEWFSEANIAIIGTAADPTQATKAIGIPDGYTIDTSSDGWVYKGVESGYKVYTKVNGDAGANNGTLTYYVNDEGQRLTYTLTSPAEHSEQGVATSDKAYGSVGSVTLKDAVGNIYEVGTQFVIYDDQPKVSLTGDPSAESGKTYTGSWNVVYGADGPAGKDSLQAEVNVKIKLATGEVKVTGSITVDEPFEITDDKGNVYGSLTLREDGLFDFRPAPNLKAEFSFDLIAVDGDGDVVRAENGELAISVAPPVGPGVTEIFTKDGEKPDEANLPTGSHRDDSALAKEINVPDGYTVDTSGWEDKGNGVYELKDGQYGKLVYDGTTLKYELTDPAGHGGQGKDNLVDRVPGVTLVDKYGNEYEVTAKVEIIDDMAVAGIKGDEETIVSGGTHTGSWSVDYGADGAAKSADEPLKVRVTVNGESEEFVFTPGQEVTVIIGNTEYGKLTLNGNQNGGGYVFEAAPDLYPLDVNFAVIAKDGDGDVTVSKGVNLQVTDPAGPGVNHLGGKEGEEFYEKNLDWGTDSSADALSKPISIPDGFSIDTGEAVMVGSETRSWIETGQGSGVFTLKGSYGTFTYTAGDPPKLTYLLEKQAGHPAGDGANSIHDQIKGITLKDGNGNSHVLDAKIEIVDDVPEVNFGGTGNTDIVSGHDYVGTWGVEHGADGAASGEEKLFLVVKTGGKTSDPISITPGDPTEITVNGKVYGTITLDANTGRYVFTAAPDTTAILDFTLYATDADGDRSDSGRDFTINVERATDPNLPSYLGGKEGEGFDEANLGKGTASDPDLLTKPIALPDGYTIDTDGWQPAGNGVWTKAGANGFLKYDTTGSTPKLTYTLESAPKVPGEGKNVFQDLIEDITLVDGKGNTFELDAKISITDDVPQVNFGGSGGASGTVTSGTEFASGTWNVEYGADEAAKTDSLVLQVRLVGGASADPIAVVPGSGPIEIKVGSTVYGHLTLNKNGTYTFEAEANTTGQLNFVLVAKDADGDISKTPGFDLTIRAADGPDIPHLGYDKTFSEANFDNGTDRNTALLVQQLEVPKGFHIDVKSSGWVLQGDGTYKLAGAKGFLTCSADGRTLKYTLTERVANDGTDRVEHDGDRGFDLISNIKLLDKNDNEFSLNAKIEIIDDAPKLDFSGGQVIHIDSGERYTSDQGGYVLQFGADGSAQTDPLMLFASIGNQKSEPVSIPPGGSRDVIIDGVNYGKLFLHEDGTFTFKARPNIGEDKSIHLNLSLLATDRDGDIASTQEKPVTIVITKPAGPDAGYYIGGNGEEFSESFLTGGTAQGNGDLTQILTLPKGFTPDTTGWTSQGNGVFTKSGDNNCGKLTWDGKNLTYTLEKNAQHGLPNTATDKAVQDMFNGIKLKDDNGNTYDVPAKITILDDAPIVEFKAAQNDTADDIYGVDSGTVSTGTIQVEGGADGLASVKIDGIDVMSGTAAKPVVISREGGTLKIWNDNRTIKYEYTANTNDRLTGNKSDKFTVTATDKDGDVVSDNLTMNVKKVTLGDGGDNEIGKGEEGARANEAGLPTGSSAKDGSAQSDWVGFELPKGATSIDTGSFQGKYGTFEIRYENGEYQYRYTLTTNYKHDADSDLALDVDKIVVTIRDDKGNTGKANLYADIVDDSPAAEFKADKGDLENDSYTVDSGSVSTGSIAVVEGADGVSSVKVENIEVTASATKSNPLVFTKDAGTLKVWNDNGTIRYEYTAKTNDELGTNRSDKFTVVVTDSDGDKASDTLTMFVGKKDLGGEDDNEIGKGDEGARADEAGLPTGSSANDGSTQSKWVSFELPEGATSIQTGTFQGKYGTFEIQKVNGEYQYRYTLTTNYKHGANSDLALDVDKIVVTITDELGNTGKASLYADIVDDAPTTEFKADKGDLENDNYTVGSGSVSTGSIAVVGGADGVSSVKVENIEVTASATKSNPLVFTKDAGTLKVWNDNGTIKYEYTAKTNDELGANRSDSFTVVVTDTDGDKDSDTLTMTVGKKDLGGEDDNEIGKGDEGARANEAGLSTGNPENTGSAQSEWVKFDLPEGATNIEVGEFQGKYGTFEIKYENGGYQYRYTLTTNYKHDAGSDLALDVDRAIVTIRDADGNTGKASLYADIVDDTPTFEFKADNGDTPEDVYAVATGSVSTGVLGVFGGADGIASISINGTPVSTSGSTPVFISNSGGTLKVWNDNGTFRYEYTAKDRSELTSQVKDKFTVTVVDGDGDVASDTMEMIVTPPNTAPVAVDDYAVINEDGEQNVSGNLLANDKDADGDALTVTSTGTFNTSYGTITVNADGTYSYEVNLNNTDVQALYNGTSSDPSHKLTDSFTYQIADGYGGTHEATINIDLTPNQLRTPEKGSNEVTGGPGNDVILGDAIGQTDISDITYKAYNVSIILDNSRSFADDFEGAKRAVGALVELLEEMGESEYTHINLSFISFSDSSKLEFGINGLDTKAELQAFMDMLENVGLGGATNYEHAFMQSSNWFSQQPKTVTDEFGGQGKDVAYSDVVYFITDGDPTKCVQKEWSPAKDAGDSNYPAVTVADWVPGEELVVSNGDYHTRIAADGTLGYKYGNGNTWTDVKSVFELSHQTGVNMTTVGTASQEAFDRYFEQNGIEVNGIGVGEQVGNIDAYDNTGGAAVVEIGPNLEEDLKKELIDNGSIKWEEEATQASVIRGGSGFSLIFGDAITADWLLEDNSWNHGSLRPGKSLEIVKQYVMQQEGLAENDPKLNDAVRRFIEDNAFKLGLSEESRGSNDIIHASERGSVIFAQGGDDTVFGGAGNDLIIGGAGDDSLLGGKGADVFLFNAEEGNDTIGDFNRAEGDIIVNVGDGVFGNIDGDFTASDVRAVKDVQHGHEITITDSNNHLLVGAGINSDRIEVDGVKYDNVLKGGSGDDVIFGGSGNNLLIGGSGNDHIIGGPDDDRIEGGSGNDFIHAGAGDDLVFGGSGNNTIFGGGGMDTFAWNNLSSGGRDNIMDFSSGEGDRLNFEDLLDPGESLELFIDNHINNLNMDTLANTLNFTIKDGSFSKDVEVHFDPANDSLFSNVLSEYRNAGSPDEQQDVLVNFLLSISNN